MHIHHFWFGLVLLAVGGWLGIAFSQKQVDIVAAVLYGAGGGLIVDEVGLLLTFGDYWSGLTWTFLVIILSFASVAILFIRYRATIGKELSEFVGSKASPYLGVFLFVLSIAFILETDEFFATAISGVLLTIGGTLIVIFLIKGLKERMRPA